MINLALQPAQRIATNSAEEQQAWEESPQIPTVPNQSDTINLFLEPPTIRPQPPEQPKDSPDKPTNNDSRFMLTNEVQSPQLPTFTRKEREIQTEEKNWNVDPAVAPQFVWRSKPTISETSWQATLEGKEGVRNERQQGQPP